MAKRTFKIQKVYFVRNNQITRALHPGKDIMM